MVGYTVNLMLDTEYSTSWFMCIEPEVRYTVLYLRGKVRYRDPKVGYRVFYVIGYRTLYVVGYNTAVVE